jgi:hypothetical protein
LCSATDDAIVVNGTLGCPHPGDQKNGRRQKREARKTMSGDLDKRGEGAETLGQKIDTLAASIDHRLDALSASVDERFTTLSASVDERFTTLSVSVDERFTTLSVSVDERFDAVDVALVEQRQYTEFAFDRLDSRFDRLERKLDQFIDTQSATNKLVERRLTALEPRSAHE